MSYFAQHHGMPKGAADEAAKRWLTTGLGDRAKDKLEALSHGNQQRVQLGAALVHDPELLVLDEPFSGLDPIGVATMTEILRERASAGVGVVFSSHQLDLVEDVCEDVVIIARGRIVARGRSMTSARPPAGGISRSRWKAPRHVARRSWRGNARGPEGRPRPVAHTGRRGLERSARCGVGGRTSPAVRVSATRPLRALHGGGAVASRWRASTSSQSGRSSSGARPRVPDLAAHGVLPRGRDLPAGIIGGDDGRRSASSDAARTVRGVPPGRRRPGRDRDQRPADPGRCDRRGHAPGRKPRRAAGRRQRVVSPSTSSRNAAPILWARPSAPPMPMLAPSRSSRGGVDMTQVAAAQVPPPIESSRRRIPRARRRSCSRTSA